MIEKYEARVLFAGGFKILCEAKGKDPHIAGVKDIHAKTTHYM